MPDLVLPEILKQVQDDEIPALRIKKSLPFGVTIPRSG